MKQPKEGEFITIKSYKHDGSLHRTWRDTMVLKTSDQSIIGCNDHTLVTESDGRRWVTREAALLYYHQHFWFNIVAMIRKRVETLGIPALERVSIDTVERYQGSQRDVIIYSFTIQQHYQLDFLTGNCFEENGHVIDRKLNVALTRARKQMIITGNEQLMKANRVFAELIREIDEKQGIWRQ